MTRPTRQRSSPGFDETCATLAELLDAPVRQQTCESLARSRPPEEALLSLRAGMQSHVWKVGARRVSLKPAVAAFDGLTRGEGFHALHDWDGIADHVNEHSIPVDVLDFMIRQRGNEPADPAVLSILLDYYFLYVLALLSLRIWDAGNPDGNLDRLGVLLAVLQGPHGSGQRFADDAATLLLVATSHYELEERGFGALLAKVRTLSPPHRSKVALGHAAAMGCHLRFGFAATYARDAGAMRADNVADYPWLGFALAALMHEYARGEPGPDRARLIDALLNGLSADPAALARDAEETGLWPDDAVRNAFMSMLDHHRGDLARDVEALRPDGQRYSPLSFFFNFSQNVLKGMVIDSLMWGEPSPLSLNDMLSGVSRSAGQSAAKLKLAAALMRYARSRPDRIRGRPMPVIVYDPAAGRRAFDDVLRLLRR